MTNSAPVSASVEPGLPGEIATRGDPAKHMAGQDWQTAFCHPKQHGPREPRQRHAQGISAGESRRVCQWYAIHHPQGRWAARRAQARRAHWSSGIVSRGTCLHDPIHAEISGSRFFPRSKSSSQSPLPAVARVSRRSLARDLDLRLRVTARSLPAFVTVRWRRDEAQGEPEVEGAE